MNTMDQHVMPFLSILKLNNNREWFAEHKNLYESAKESANEFYRNIGNELHKIDDVQFQKMFRIYRDVRFSQDKSPYKTHFGADFIRHQPYNRGSFYVHLEPDNMLVGGGFWNPDKADLQRIRKAIEIEDDLEQILNEIKRKEIKFGHAFGDPPLKTAPKGFDKNHPRKNLLCHKQFVLIKNIDYQNLSTQKLIAKIVAEYQNMLPFFYYMTEVLTTNENGESIIDEQ